MDYDMSSPNQEENEPKAEFRKLTNEAASRKYRRRSPVSGSSDGDGSPKRDYMSRGISKASNYDRRNSDKVDDGSSGYSQRGRGGDSYRHSSRGDRHDEHSRHGKHADEDGRTHAVSSRSRRDSKGGTNADYRDRESEYNSSRDRYRDVNRYPRDKSDRTRYDGRHGGRYSDRDRHSRDKDYHRDEKRDYRSSRDRRDDRPYGNYTGRQTDSGSIKETGDMKDVDGSKDSQDKSENEELVRHEDSRNRIGSSDDRSAFVSEEFAAKRPKFRKGSDQGEDCAASPEQRPVSGADSVSSVDAAKVAALKAAQIVNQNLTSTGFMTADQKKKLLWGNKKSSGVEESSHHWDTSLFPDRERQEKFHKLMSLRLPWYIWPIVGCERRSEGGCETYEQSRCRKAESTSAGFREAIHCWSPTERWPHCRVRSVKCLLFYSLTDKILFRNFIYLCIRFLERIVFIHFVHQSCEKS